MRGKGVRMALPSSRSGRHRLSWLSGSFAGIALVILAAALALSAAACGEGGGPLGGGASPGVGGSVSSSSSAASAAPSPAVSSPSAPSPAAAAATASLSRLFPAPRGPLDLRVTGTGDWDGVPVRHVTYRSDGAVVTAVLSVPAGAGPYPAVLYAPGVSCRADMFAADVAALQRAGIAALAVDPPDGRDPFVEPVSLSSATVKEAQVRYVTDLRRGFDVLLSLPEVDPERLGYVGYSWGGFVGGYLAGLREPAHTWVLTYAGADWVGADPGAAPGFVGPAEAIAAGRPGAYLFQAGVDDPLFSRASVQAYFDAAPRRKRLDWYPGGHGDLWAVPDARMGRSHRVWLEKHL